MGLALYQSLIRGHRALITARNYASNFKGPRTDSCYEEMRRIALFDLYFC